ncbi:porin [Ralstonia sp. UBA689]|uniref:porin n=1 Tax=Ralstonia sp. UBA689 TaxID=1947373 RepID=UPI0025E1F825|nr:porin [Ralstonia sp. UBA689]
MRSSNAVKSWAALGVCAAALAMLSTPAQASVSVYGRIDTAVRYSTNQTISGNDLLELTSGASSASRWGIKGSEGLGGSINAIFTLESGFHPGSGQPAQGGLLFGRQAWVGLSGGFGTLTFGRQYSPVYLVEFANEPFGWANLYEPAFIYDNYTGGNRWNHSVSYTGKAGSTTASLAVGLGEQAGNGRSGRKLGGSLAYAAGPISASAAWQQTRNANGTANHTVWTAGGVLTFNALKLYLSHLNHRSALTPQRNEVWVTGASYAVRPAIELYAAFYVDRQHAQRGSRRTVAAMLNYKLSSRTNAYLQADTSRIDAGYATNVFNAYAFPMATDTAGRVTGFVRSRSSVTVGVRHQF